MGQIDVVIVHTPFCCVDYIVIDGRTHMNQAMRLLKLVVSAVFYFDNKIIVNEPSSTNLYGPL